MAYTMQQVVDKARQPLNDEDKERYADTELLGYANDATLLLRNKRPDLFFGMYASAITAKTIDEAFSLDDTLVPAVCDYVTARAESKNDESVLSERAAIYFALFKGQVQ